MKPADPTTLKTSIMRAKKVCEDCDQSSSVYTCDEQLYRISLFVLFDQPDLFKNFFLRLGGMHLIMSYVGSIGTLMSGSGLEKILERIFGGVQKTLGKKFPENVRALRLLTEELLRMFFLDSPVDNCDSLMNILEEKATISKTSKFWVNALIKPVFLLMMYARAEREGELTLHHYAVNQMLPLFFAAGHVHYARYGLYYIRSMKSMTKEICEHFLNGDHTVQHMESVFSGIWSDMAIETYMRFGPGPVGVVRKTLKPETLKVWAYSQSACTKIVSDLEEMNERNKNTSEKHKEEENSRLKDDAKDRSSLRAVLSNYIHPLDPKQHPTNDIVNIVTG